ncbi:hypothetical protein [Bacillus sp. EB600]|uniref:hypothetical protein n=1 Tax=Bacillus sp. EB600 TaxID=2806345 RepID=UPI00210AA474|nr:hypothetical protein [Bacillus sp. EB600]MCQ6282855.1 hypothetical protein [Bacillus sp. EB600]
MPYAFHQDFLAPDGSKITAQFDNNKILRTAEGMDREGINNRLEVESSGENNSSMLFYENNHLVLKFTIAPSSETKGIKWQLQTDKKSLVFDVSLTQDEKFRVQPTLTDIGGTMHPANTEITDKSNLVPLFSKYASDFPQNGLSYFEPMFHDVAQGARTRINYMDTTTTASTSMTPHERAELDRAGWACFGAAMVTLATGGGPWGALGACVIVGVVQWELEKSMDRETEGGYHDGFSGPTPESSPESEPGSNPGSEPESDPERGPSSGPGSGPPDSGPDSGPGNESHESGTGIGSTPGHRTLVALFFFSLEQAYPYLVQQEVSPSTHFLS